MCVCVYEIGTGFSEMRQDLYQFELKMPYEKRTKIESETIENISGDFNVNSQTAARLMSSLCKIDR